MVSEPVWATVSLAGLRCQGAHGAYEGEQDQPRLFLVDVRVRLDILPAAASDDLAQALDLAALAETIRAVLGGPPRTLLETLALEACQSVLNRFDEAQEVWLRLAKPDPPGLDAAEEAVEVSLSRDS